MIEGLAYMTQMLIYHNILNIFWFYCKITLESVPGTNQY